MSRFLYCSLLSTSCLLILICYAGVLYRDGALSTESEHWLDRRAWLGIGAILLGLLSLVSIFGHYNPDFFVMEDMIPCWPQMVHAADWMITKGKSGIRSMNKKLTPKKKPRVKTDREKGQDKVREEYKNKHNSDGSRKLDSESETIRSRSNTLPQDRPRTRSNRISPLSGQLGRNNSLDK